MMKSSKTATPGHDGVFGEIYRRNLWGSRESRSGTGSTLESTRRVREYLPDLVQRLGVKTLIDVPCGDFYWMKTIDLGCDYLGIDVVDEVVTDNTQRYAERNRKFLRRDVRDENVPRGDLILSRDLLVHFSFADIFRALNVFLRSETRWLLATTFIHREENIDIQTGDWRPLNLQIHPFNFPEPTELLIEGSDEADGLFSDKALALWPLKNLPIGKEPL